MRKFNDWTFFYVFTICNIGFEYCKSNVPFCTMPGLHCTPYSVLSTLHVVIYNDMTLLLLFHLGKSSWSIWLLDILELEFDWFSPGVGLGLHMWSMQILFGWIITTLVKPNIRWFGFGHQLVWSSLVQLGLAEWCHSGKAKHSGGLINSGSRDTHGDVGEGFQGIQITYGFFQLW